MTTATASLDPVDAAEVAMIRPGDLAAHQSLYRLAHQAGARVQRGAICLVGHQWPAWLAISPDGWVLAAVLLSNPAGPDTQTDDLATDFSER